MSAEFAFPTAQVTAAASDILAASSRLSACMEHLESALAKASGAWEGAAASDYLGRIQSCLKNNREAPAVMALNIGKRLNASAGNYGANELIATEKTQSILDAFG